jgi:hypothetical protein
LDVSYPGIGVAATELLELAGFKVELADNICCGPGRWRAMAASLTRG